MTYIGFQALNIALVFAAFSTIVYFIGGRFQSERFLKSAQRGVYVMFAMVLLGSLALLYALFARDFSIEYVAHYSNRSLSWFYTAAAFWAGQAGSLLLWALLLSLFAVIVLRQNKHSVLLPYTMGVINFTTFFFLYLLVFKTNPFQKLAIVPPDGNGLNPLLQNPGMIFHPPSLYIGFVGFTVPFAFAVAALLTKNLDDQWVKKIRMWTLFSWLFLTVGNILGMQWAYVELGWGGYWAWDPVENSSLLPWLTGTAFLHSVIVQERRGMLKIWNISLVTLTFALTIFGTFVTRSGLISSVHAFGVSDMGPLFLGFLALILLVSFYLLFLRKDLLKNKRELGSWTSKESSFLLNNLFFVALTLGVFLGTIMPTLSELVRGEKMTVSIEFFNKMATPVGLSIFFLIGVCTLFSWGKTSLQKLTKNLIAPGLITVAFILFLFFIGIRKVLPLMALGIVVFATLTTIIDYVRGVWVKKKTGKRSFLSSLLFLILNNKRRYGGYIVHLGALMFLLGIIGSSAFSIEETKTLKKGESLQVKKYKLVYKGIVGNQEKGYLIDAAVFDLYKNEKPIGEIKAEKHLHPNFQPATEVGIRSTLIEDLYVILANYDKQSQLATISVMVNPLVLWIWIGGIVMVLGTFISLSPTLKKKTN